MPTEKNPFDKIPQVDEEPITEEDVLMIIFLMIVLQ